jgi:hypothetical protein
MPRLVLGTVEAPCLRRLPVELAVLDASDEGVPLGGSEAVGRKAPILGVPHVYGIVRALLR